ncbi:MAG TPA: M1 family aminopeptidase, partial [Candidatus Aminicenantes bacterium]|nr:M1 family aminopeptidase [Candidatus Aminicenantes bacterium]
SLSEQISGWLTRQGFTAPPPFDGDASFAPIMAHFAPALRVFPMAPGKTSITYLARFPTYGEIGLITYVEKDGRAFDAARIPQIYPLHFIERFRKVAVKGVRFAMGEARVEWREGTLYVPEPAPGPLIFVGRWEFRITPSNGEERLTLRNLSKQEEFVESSPWALFQLTAAQTKAVLPGGWQTAPTVSEDEVKPWIRDFQAEYGFQVGPFGETWYAAFGPEFQMVSFSKRREHSFCYTFDPNAPSDTTLMVSPGKRILLNYHSGPARFLFGGGDDPLEKLTCRLNYTPASHFLSGEASLLFKSPSPIKAVLMAPGLRIRAYLPGKGGLEINQFRRSDTYYLFAPASEELQQLRVFFGGRINPVEAGGDLLRGQSLFGEDQEYDQFSHLSRDQSFYPNPGVHFFPSEFSISLPNGNSCLATGRLTGQTQQNGRTTFTFSSPPAKGVSLICGPFQKERVIPGKLPLNVYSSRLIRLEHVYDPVELSAIGDFLVTTFGPLELPELNILLQKGRDFGGVSNTGFIVCHLPPASHSFRESTRRRVIIEGPLVLDEIRRDNLVHEMAHQWWGGLLSWKNYKDVWITEGLAHYATLQYLRRTLSPARFHTLIAGQVRWAIRKSTRGPIAYGQRIANVTGDYDAYQAIVYSKSALVISMLRHMLGEEELHKRLRGALEKFRHRSITGAQMTTHLAQGDPLLTRFFSQWLNQRRVPAAAFTTRLEGNTAVITVRQSGESWVFPLGVTLKTGQGDLERTIVVSEAEQEFRLEAGTPVQAVRVDNRESPVTLAGD